MANTLLQEILTEREYQKEMWGGPEKDACQNSPADFVLYINKYATSWFKGGLPPHDTEGFRKTMIKVATLAVAAIEAYDYKENHDG